MEPIATQQACKEDGHIELEGLVTSVHTELQQEFEDGQNERRQKEDLRVEQAVNWARWPLSWSRLRFKESSCCCILQLWANTC